MSHLTLFLIAGEPSGDRLGAALMAGLKQVSDQEIRFHGLGGPLMQAEGLASLFPIDELSIMGLTEVVPRIPGLIKRIRETVQAIEKTAPSALVTIDSPDFCLRVARRAKQANPTLRTMHYVAPSVWAWRPGRAQKMARSIDHVLALLPFEPPYMTAAGMSCDFVGHPVVADPKASDAEIAAFRAELTSTADQRILTLLPGSRLGEVARLAPVFRTVAERIVAQRPDMRVVIPTVSAVADRLHSEFANSPVRPVILDSGQYSPAVAEARKRACFAASAGALAASGTVSLELAAAGTPMVVAYRANPVTTWMVKRLSRVSSATLVNLLTESRAIPEFLFENCTADAITPVLADLLDDPDAARAQRKQGEKAMEMLGRSGEAPGIRAARSVLANLG